MAKKSKKVKTTKNAEKQSSYYGIVGILVIIGIVVIGVVLGYTMLHNSASSSVVSSTPVYGKFFKVSNQDYAPPGETDIYLVSWYGCPFGAAMSWPLYMLLSHYGNLNVSLHESIAESDIGGAVPGLLFFNFTPNSTVRFVVYYLTNQYLNATVNGTPINGSVLTFMLNELKSEAPSWLYNYVFNYTNVYPLIREPNGSVVPVNFAGRPPHIISTLVITGPGGTYMLIGEPYGQYITTLTTYTPQELYNDILNHNVPSFIQQVYEEFYQVLQLAMS